MVSRNYLLVRLDIYLNCLIAIATVYQNLYQWRSFLTKLKISEYAEAIYKIAIITSLVMKLCYWAFWCITRGSVACTGGYTLSTFSISIDCKASRSSTIYGVSALLYVHTPLAIRFSKKALANVEDVASFPSKPISRNGHKLIGHT